MFNYYSHFKFVGFQAGYKNTDIRYSATLGRHCKNTFTGYVYIPDLKKNYQYPVYRFERSDKQENNRVHFYALNNAGKMYFVKNPAAATENV